MSVHLLERLWYSINTALGELAFDAVQLLARLYYHNRAKSVVDQLHTFIIRSVG